MHAVKARRKQGRSSKSDSNLIMAAVTFIDTIRLHPRPLYGTHLRQKGSGSDSSAAYCWSSVPCPSGHWHPEAATVCDWYVQGRLKPQSPTFSNVTSEQLRMCWALVCLKTGNCLSTNKASQSFPVVIPGGCAWRQDW